MMKTDVLVIGGGPNGLAAALALGGHVLRTPLSVTVIDARDPRSYAAIGNDTRGTAMTRATQAMLTALGLWPDLAPFAEDLRHITVTDGTGNFDQRPTLLSFATDENNRAAASMVENRHIATALLKAVDRSPSITLIPNAGLAQLITGPGLAEATTTAGTNIRSTLVIGADGRASRTREILGIKTQGQDYGQTALGFSISHELDHKGTAQEHFSPDGVFAFLPLPDNRASIVWGTSPPEAQRLVTMDDGQFLKALEQKIGPHLGHLALAGKRTAYPIISQIAEQFVAPRTALVGDAAHAIHPLAGLGLNLGYKDVAALADVVAAAFARGDDIGSSAVLESYQRHRRFDTWATSMAMEALNGLFSNNLPVLRELRKTGLQLVDGLPNLKSILMKQAAGETNDLPRLMQGLLPA